MSTAPFKNKIMLGDAAEILRQIPDAGIDCIVTSPPYFALRDYCIEGQIGLEPSFQEYIEKLCAVFDECARVLKPTGTCWVNLGDTYGTGSGAGVRKGMQATNRGTQYNRAWEQKGKNGVRGMEKSLLQIPARFAIAMTERGWILRNTIIWHKPNAMPHSVKDRFTADFEYLFFFAKNQRYFFEQQLDPYTAPLNRWGGPKTKATEHKKGDGYAVLEHEDRDRRPNPEGRNKRCVWSISTKPCKDAHFATFPPELIETPIKAGCPEAVCAKCGTPRFPIYKNTMKQHSIGATSGAYWKTRNFKGDNTVRNMSRKVGYTDCGCNAGWRAGIVLDPFIGSGTTAVTAQNLGRDFIGIELNPEYVQIAERRLAEIPASLFKHASAMPEGAR